MRTHNINFDDQELIRALAHQDITITVGELSMLMQQFRLGGIGEISNNELLRRASSMYEQAFESKDSSHMLDARKLKGLVDILVARGEGSSQFTSKFYDYVNTVRDHRSADVAAFEQYRVNNPVDFNGILNGEFPHLQYMNDAIVYGLNDKLCSSIRELADVERNLEQNKASDKLISAMNNYVVFIMQIADNLQAMTCIKLALNAWRLPFEVKRMPAWEQFAQKYQKTFMN